MDRKKPRLGTLGSGLRETMTLEPTPTAQIGNSPSYPRRWSSGSLAILAAIRRASSRVSSLAADCRLILEIDVGERLPVSVAEPICPVCENRMILAKTIRRSFALPEYQVYECRHCACWQRSKTFQARTILCTDNWDLGATRYLWNGSLPCRRRLRTKTARRMGEGGPCRRPMLKRGRRRREWQRPGSY